MTAADAAEGDLFGRSVALSGDTALIGADMDDHSGADSGSAYVFVESGGLWTEQQKLTPGDGETEDWFGISVAISGDKAVIGAHGDGNHGGADAGAAYTFTRSGGIWSEDEKLVAADAADSDLFGYSVALTGDMAVAGAPNDDHTGFSDAGSAYVFEGPRADLAITKDDGQAEAVPGEPVTYTIVASNAAGPSDMSGAAVSDVFPAELTGCSWTCVGAGGGTCSPGPVAGDISDTIELPVGGTATYTTTCTIDPSASGLLVNTVTVTTPAGASDPITGNNTAVDETTLVGSLFADGFESGDTSAWTASVPGYEVGELALAGPRDEFWTSFRVDLELLRSLGPQPIVLLSGIDGRGLVVFDYEAAYETEGLVARARARLDDGSWVETERVRVGAGAEWLEFEWRRAMPDLFDGYLVIRRDGAFLESLDDLANAESDLHAIGLAEKDGRAVVFDLSVPAAAR